MKRIFSILFALVLVLSFSLIPATPVMAAVINVPADQPTIQAAINAAQPGDTIHVAAGTYSTATNGETFPITVDKGLTLLGANHGIPGMCARRGGESTIDPNDTDTVNYDGFFVTSGGVTIDGFEIIDADDPILCWFTGDMANIAIKNNVIDNTDGQPAGGTSGIAFTAVGGIHSADGALVTANTINQGGHQDKNALTFDGVYGAFTVRGNTITNFFGSCSGMSLTGAYEWGYSRVSLDGTVIVNNTVRANAQWGFGIGFSLVDGHVTLTGNTVTDCFVGIKSGGICWPAWPDFSTGISAHVNNLEGNIFGVHNEHSDPAYVVHARANWWGAANGPGYSGPGDGAWVSTNVLYKPWLKKALPKW